MKIRILKIIWGPIVRMCDLEHLPQLSLKFSVSQDTGRYKRRGEWQFTHWLAKPCSLLWPLHLKNNSSVSGRRPQVMALMYCHKHEWWNTEVGSDTAFLPVPAFLEVKSFFGKTVWAIIFMAELILFTIQSSCCHFWFQTIFHCYICILLFITKTLSFLIVLYVASLVI